MHQIHHPHNHLHPHHSTGVHCTWRWRTSQWRWTTPRSSTQPGAGPGPLCCQAGQVCWGAVVDRSAADVCRANSEAPSCCCCSALPWRATRVAQSRHCNSEQCSRGWGGKAASPPLWSVWTAYWLDWPGFASQRSSNHPTCFEPVHKNSSNLTKYSNKFGSKTCFSSIWGKSAVYLNNGSKGSFSQKLQFLKLIKVARKLPLHPWTEWSIEDVTAGNNSWPKVHCQI